VKVVEGWRRIDNQRGYMNVTTGQNLVVTKREFGEHYSVMLFPMMRNDKEEGMPISPEFTTRSKAETLAMDWMNKHPRGIE
jgi:hypothetical protein